VTGRAPVERLRPERGAQSAFAKAAARPRRSSTNVGGPPSAEKEHALRRTLASWPAVIVAYSGGVDSAYLGALAIRIAEDFGFEHEIIRTDEMARPEYRANPANRCYYCKHELYTHLSAIARERGIPAIADGSNADDRGDYRPGRQAAREFGVVSPLDASGLTKAEIRELSRRAGLPTWDEPASACLSSRIPYFSEVTDKKLRMIEQAEAVLRELGFRVCRVRHHGEDDAIARLEIGRDEMARALEPDVADTIDRALRAIGYRHVTLDLRGYRLGSLNDALRLRQI